VIADLSLENFVDARERGGLAFLTRVSPSASLECLPVFHHPRPTLLTSGLIVALCLALASAVTTRSSAFSPGPSAPTIASDTCGVKGSCTDVPGRGATALRARRMSATGTPAANPSTSSLCTREVHAQRAVSVSDGQGGLLIAWIEPSDLDAPVRALRRDSTGSVVSGWAANGVVLCAAPGQRSMLRLVADGAGGAIAGWVDHRDPSRGRIFAQRVTGSGAIASGWSADGVVVTADSTDQAAPALATDGLGGAFVAWQKPRPTGTAVRLLRLAPDGTRGSGWPDTGLVVSAHDSAQAAPVVIGDGANGVAIAWEDHRAGAASQLYATRVTMLGAPVPTWPANGLRVSTASAAQRFARLAGDGLGGAYVVWHDARSGAGRLYAQHLASTGAVAPGWPFDGLGVSTSSGEQFDAAAAPDESGGVLIAWIDYRGGVAGDVYMQRLALDGTRPAGWPSGGAAVCPDPADSFRPTLVDVAAGAATVAWDDVGEDGLVTGVIEGPLPDRIAVQWISEGLGRGGLVVRFALVSDAPAALEVVDVMGRRVSRRSVERFGPGWHVMSLDAHSGLAPGVYFVRLTQASRSVATKAIYLR